MGNNTFHIGALIGQITLSHKHHKEYFIIKKTKNIEIILKFLFKENFIKTYFNFKNNFIVFLKYRPNSVIKKIEMISIPSKKIYVNLYTLKSILYKNKNSFYLLSTSKGILSGYDAIKLNVGGELLFQITI